MPRKYRIVYPESPLKPHTVEELCEHEYYAARKGGVQVSLFSFEELLDGRLSSSPKSLPGETVIYRGWMLTSKQYNALYNHVSNTGAKMLTTPKQYELTHYLPNWYGLLKEFTPETKFIDNGEDLVDELTKLGWEGYFVKDHVKSIASLGKSFISDPLDIQKVVENMNKFRGKIEGGLCIRRPEIFKENSERRHIVFRRKVYSRDGMTPEIAKIAAKKINSPFFTVDTAIDNEGEHRIVELGDGQVSDLKLWKAQELIEIITGAYGKDAISSTPDNLIH